MGREANSPLQSTHSVFFSLLAQVATSITATHLWSTFLAILAGRTSWSTINMVKMAGDEEKSALFLFSES
jgi:hypothetical protein